jgi:endonuclease/exonuclease/phosphatase family metal-dependent hydrolase
MADDASPSPMMRIATWNVARPTSRERTRLARLRDAIAAIDADVWVFSETHDVLSSSVASHLCSTRTQDRPCEDGERWVTIASRWALEPLATTDDARTAAALVHPPDACPFIVFGTVLPWLGSRWRDVDAPNGAAFAASLAVQLADWRRIHAELPDAPFVLAGDLNQDLAARHVYGSRRNRAAIEAALAAASLRCLTAGADDPVPHHAPQRASVDHICVDAQVRHAGPVRSWPREPEPPRTLSDHFGLAVDLTGLS